MKLLVVGYLPPPYFGPSVTYQALMRSEFAKKFDITFLDITVAESIDDIERFRPGKLFKMAGFLLREFWLLATRRFDFCFCPVSVNRNAFIKDAILLGLARMFGVRTVLYAHGNNLPDFHTRSSPRIQRLIERTASRAAGAIVLGESLRFNFEKWLPVEKIFVVPTGIEPASIPPRQPHEGVTVLYLGNLVREKGVFVLIEAARLCPELNFVFAGSVFRETPVAPPANVSFIGPVAGASKWKTIASSDILAFPTFYYNETMGLVLLEAMQAGIPVVTTRRASIPEIVQGCGLLVNEQDPKDLAEKIRTLARDPSLREKLGAAGRQRFEEYYTHEHYGRRMSAVFEKLSRD